MLTYNNPMELEHDLKSLNNLIDKVFKATHSATVDGKKYIIFRPTSFMYMFTTFNTMYSINWNETFAENKIVYNTSQDQTSLIRAMLSFSCNDNRGDKDYVRKFLSNMRRQMTNHVILTQLDNFTLDVPKEDSVENINFSWSRANFTEKSQKSSFTKAVKEVLEQENVTCENLYKIANTIYHVRCNIFHGIKGFDIMKEQRQEDRLEIYTQFLYAICKMVIHSAKIEFKSKYGYSPNF